MGRASLMRHGAVVLALLTLACAIWQASWLTTSGFALERGLQADELRFIAVVLALALPSWLGWMATPILAARTGKLWIFLLAVAATFVMVGAMTSLALAMGCKGFSRDMGVILNLPWLLYTWLLVLPSGIFAAFLTFALGRASGAGPSR